MRHVGVIWDEELLGLGIYILYEAFEGKRCGRKFPFFSIPNL